MRSTGHPDPPRAKRVRPGSGGAWPRTAENQSGHPAAVKMPIGSPGRMFPAVLPASLPGTRPSRQGSGSNPNSGEAPRSFTQQWQGRTQALSRGISGGRPRIVQPPLASGLCPMLTMFVRPWLFVVAAHAVKVVPGGGNGGGSHLVGGCLRWNSDATNVGNSSRMSSDKSRIA